MSVSFRVGQQVIYNNSFATLQTPDISSSSNAISAALATYGTWSIVDSFGNVLATHTEEQLLQFQASGSLSIFK